MSEHSIYLDGWVQCNERKWLPVESLCVCVFHHCGFFCDWNLYILSPCLGSRIQLVVSKVQNWMSLVKSLHDLKIKLFWHLVEMKWLDQSQSNLYTLCRSFKSKLLYYNDNFLLLFYIKYDDSIFHTDKTHNHWQNLYIPASDHSLFSQLSLHKRDKKRCQVDKFISR